MNAELLKNEILELKSKGKTIIFSTHNMASVEEICDDIALIDKSKVVLSGNVSEIRSQYKTNIFDVCITAPELSLNPEIYILIGEKHTHNGSKSFRIKKSNEQITNSELLSALIQTNEIVSFEEEIPSMNEIFINTVNREMGVVIGTTPISQLPTPNIYE